jgi:hypothetical protein
MVYTRSKEIDGSSTTGGRVKASAERGWRRQRVGGGVREWAAASESGRRRQEQRVSCNTGWRLEKSKQTLRKIL